ncbi:hypothetical protein [Gelidibacter japonicus]|jgi:hypothetical protein|uniref:hypothetical protein n=1 Tax=Gelidibacter japonicus TaxID=1962232 RepID=UPI0020225DE6|nr:hypothetical protein [Gelidibacter japonicus]MCL8007278.1 hypothetical protein [Gelidibacter japonicus]
MNTAKRNIKYVEWLSAEDMHKDTLDWISELEFTKDEHSFFENLVNLYTLQLIVTKKFSESSEIIDAINQSEKANILLLEAIKIHRNELQIMVDGIDQLKEEENYKKEHRNLIILVNEFLDDYQSLKTQLFGVFREIIRNEKQKYLLKNR